MVLGKLHRYMKKNNITTPPNTISKLKSKWIIRPETIKLLEENIDRSLSDINHSQIFFDRLLVIKRNEKWVICKDVDGARDCHRVKSERENIVC